MRINSDYILTEWLVLNAQSGNQEALDQLVRIWYPKLLRYAKYQTDSHEDAQDIVQECLLVLARRLKRLKDPATFPKWIYQILHRRGIDHLRKKIRKRQLIDDSKEHDLENVAVTRNSEIDNNIDITAVLKKLDKGSALVVHLHYLEGLNMQEMADVIGIPVGTVKSRLYKARQQLKKLLNE